LPTCCHHLPINLAQIFFTSQGDTKKGIEKYFTHAVGYPQIDPIIYKDSTPLGVWIINKHHPSAGSPLASGSFPVAEKWKECRCLCDGIGLGMLSIDHPIKRDDLLKDIPDNKAFYPCADDCAKSHLKWAEAFWLLLGSKSNNEIDNP